MPQRLSLDLDPTLVRRLDCAQNEFMQVLLSDFQINRMESGLCLEVDFDFETAAIWLRRGKHQVQQRLDPLQVKKYGESLREMLLGETKEIYTHADPAFPFRFGNGGALPVIRMDGEDYYCLFHRATHPVGWNIANGGAESAIELLDPQSTIERELREELIIIDPSAGNRYVFDWSEGRRSDHPEFAAARKLWQKQFGERNFEGLCELALPLKWLHGKDRVVIGFDGQEPVVLDGCLLNINSEDFGIEIDRIAKMAVGPGAVFCDGEIKRGKLLNRVVGLFKVHRLNAALAAGKGEFYPDRIFWNGLDRSNDDLRDVVNESWVGAAGRQIYSSDDGETAVLKFGLCPVTDTLIRRYLRMDDSNSIDSPEAAKVGSYDVFLSFSSESIDLARQIFDFLRERGQRVFFSDETLHQAAFGRDIDAALESARALVVVGLRSDHFMKPWVDFEWRSFHQDILGGRKPVDAPLVSVTGDVDPNSLPRPLANRQVLRWNQTAPQLVLNKLDRLLRTN